MNHALGQRLVRGVLSNPVSTRLGSSITKPVGSILTALGCKDQRLDQPARLISSATHHRLPPHSSNASLNKLRCFSSHQCVPKFEQPEPVRSSPVAVREVLGEMRTLLDEKQNEVGGLDAEDVKHLSDQMLSLELTLTFKLGANHAPCSDEHQPRVHKDTAIRPYSKSVITNESLVDRLKSGLMAGTVSFGVVSFWRGVWVLWDYAAFLDDKLLVSGACSLGTGFTVLMLARGFDWAYAPPLLPKSPKAENDKLELSQPEGGLWDRRIRDSINQDTVTESNDLAQKKS